MAESLLESCGLYPDPARNLIKMVGLLDGEEVSGERIKQTGVEGLYPGDAWWFNIRTEAERQRRSTQAYKGG